MSLKYTYTHTYQSILFNSFHKNYKAKRNSREVTQKKNDRNFSSGGQQSQALSVLANEDDHCCVPSAVMQLPSNVRQQVVLINSHVFVLYLAHSILWVILLQRQRHWKYPHSIFLGISDLYQYAHFCWQALVSPVSITSLRLLTLNLATQRFIIGDSHLCSLLNFTWHR